jgi:hypothetical protein
MNRDPDVFPDFDNFRPERFLDETETVDRAPPNTHEMGHVSYGFGKRCSFSFICLSASFIPSEFRICACYPFANQTFFIQIAVLLWALNFEKAIDKTGNPITPSKDEFIDAGVVM